MNIPKQEDLEYICRLAFDLYKIPVYLLDNKGELVFEHSINFQDNLFQSAKEAILDQIFSGDSIADFPVFSENAYLGNFFSINIHLGEQFQGKMVVGPVLFSTVPEKSIKGIINDFDLKVSNQEMANYYHSLSVLSHLDFINMSMVLFYMLYQQKLDAVVIYQNNKLLEEKRFEVEIEPLEVQVSERRQKTMAHIDPLHEKKLFQCVKEGKTAELIKTLQARPKEGQIAVLSKRSQLRSLKNLAIAGITLATRAATDGGLSPDIGYTLSDLFIQKLEELNEHKAVMQLLENALLEFSERVHKSKKLKYSKPVNKCQNYIFTHIYEDFSLLHLAELVEMNPNYLSNLFKKEVGISITEYIQQSKVDEAKSLLTYTNHPLTEISTLLNFHDQSYFTKVFKKFAGVTPKQFKNGIVNSV